MALPLRALTAIPLLAAACAASDLAHMSLEELMQIEVSLVSRKPQRVSESAAAVFVLTADDIRRSGAATLPDLLRLVPGMHVSQLDANKWALSARGFNDLFANKLLVLVDGRSVYNTLFSGVFWEAQDITLDDIERIEVIRGPGSTLWGANAVNGVINVVSRRPAQTEGGMVRTVLGTDERPAVTTRYGGRLGERGHYQVFAKGFARRALGDPPGRAAADDWHVTRAGMRADWKLDPDNRLSVEAQAYDGEVGQTMTVVTSLDSPYVATANTETPIAGRHALARWSRGENAPTVANLDVQLYYDRLERRDPPLGGTIDTADLDVQHRFMLGGHHDIVWGIGYRLTHDDIDGSLTFRLEPPSRTVNLFSFFAQDEMSLSQTRLILGSKIEHNDFTGLEWQPNARFVWLPAPAHTLWAASGHAVRLPNRVEVDERFVAAVYGRGEYREGWPPLVLAVLGNPDYRSETVTALDLGYRFRPTPRAAFDLAAYLNFYDDLRTSEPELTLPLATDPELPGYSVVPVRASNRQHGTSHGVELAADLRPHERWRLQLAYTYQNMDLELRDDSVDAVAERFEDENPLHLLVTRSSWDLPRAAEVDVITRYVDDMPALDVDGYLDVDIRLGWRPSTGVEVELVGRNLVADRRLEYARQNVITEPTRVRRAWHGGLTWRF